MRLTLDRRNYDADFDREAYVEQITKEFWDPTGNPVDAQPYPDVWLRMVRRRTADGGVITVFADISDLKRAEQRLRDAIEALAEGFALYDRSEEHTSELQSLMRRSYAVLCLNKKTNPYNHTNIS